MIGQKWLEKWRESVLSLFIFTSVLVRSERVRTWDVRQYLNLGSILC